MPAVHYEIQRGVARVTIDRPERKNAMDLAVFDERPMPDEPRRLYLFRIFAARVAAELESRRAAAALRSSEELLRSIMDNAPAAVFIKRPDGRYLLVNHEFVRVVGVPAARVVDRTDYDFLPREAAERHRQFDVAVLQSGRVVEFEDAVPSGQGPRTFLSVKFPLFDPSGRPSSLTCFITRLVSAMT